jgi:hypothetical protein
VTEERAYMAKPLGPLLRIVVANTLGEEYKLAMLGNRMLRKIFEPKRDEITADWKNCIIFTAHQIVFRCQIEKNEMGSSCGTYVGEKRCIQSFGAETEGKRPLRRPRRRLKNNVKMDLQEIGQGQINPDLARDRDKVMNLRVP